MLNKYLLDLLPEDSHERCRGKAFVGALLPAVLWLQARSSSECGVSAGGSHASLPCGPPGAHLRVGEQGTLLATLLMLAEIASTATAAAAWLQSADTLHGLQEDLVSSLLTSCHIPWCATHCTRCSFQLCQVLRACAACRWFDNSLITQVPRLQLFS